MIRALAAEPPPAKVEERVAGRLVLALGARSLPPRAVPERPRRPLPEPGLAVGRFSGFLTSLAVVLTCLTATVAQGMLPVPWAPKRPGKEVAIEQWRLVDNGRLWTDLGTDALTFSPKDGHLLMTISAKGVDSWDVANPEHPERVGLGEHGVKSRALLGVSPDGLTLVVVDGQSVLGLRTDNGQRVWSITNPHTKVKAIHVSQYSVMFAVSDATRSTQLQSVSPGETDGTRTTAKGRIPLDARAAQFSPDGKTLAIATDDGALHLWDTSSSSGPRRTGPPFPAENKRTTALAFSADGRLLATVDADHVARLWDVENPERPQPLGSPLASNVPVTAIAFSRDPRLVATVGTDRTAYLWRRN
ncbi:WD40 repeat domain-containing protein [Streptomyces paludis]|uniref:WD40 repeat domain-containing protein n=1 Tax=Streptomyces paludis TaxID=2282738 RepID=UPI0013B3F4EB|nr:WD40 repeat domain-containing protein [Streptomyces paludis]